MEKQYHKEIDQHLTLYKSEHGFSIRQRPSYVNMAMMSFCMIFLLVGVFLALVVKEYLITSIVLLVFMVVLSFFLSRSEVTFDKKNKTYTYHFFMYKFLLFAKQENYTLPLFKIYDSEIEDLTFQQSDESPIYKLQVMKGLHFENVFTFNSMESAYGFKKAIVKLDEDFYFEIKNGDENIIDRNRNKG